MEEIVAKRNSMWWVMISLRPKWKFVIKWMPKCLVISHPTGTTLFQQGGDGSSIFLTCQNLTWPWQTIVTIASPLAFPSSHGFGQLSEIGRTFDSSNITEGRVWLYRAIMKASKTIVAHGREAQLLSPLTKRASSSLVTLILGIRQPSICQIQSMHSWSTTLKGILPTW